jgi:hypothetical protein
MCVLLKLARSPVPPHQLLNQYVSRSCRLPFNLRNKPSYQGMSGARLQDERVKTNAWPRRTRAESRNGARRNNTHAETPESVGNSIE